MIYECIMYINTLGLFSINPHRRKGKIFIEELDEVGNRCKELSHSHNGRSMEKMKNRKYPTNVDESVVHEMSIRVEWLSLLLYLR